MFRMHGIKNAAWLSLVVGSSLILTGFGHRHSLSSTKSSTVASVEAAETNSQLSSGQSSLNHTERSQTPITLTGKVNSRLF